MKNNKMKNNKMKNNKIKINMKNRCNNIYKYIRKYSVCTNNTWEREKAELKFNFANFYVKHKAYLPNNLPPSSNFLSWFVGFTEGKGSFIVNNRGDLALQVLQSTSDIKVLHYIQETLGFGKVISQSIKCSRYVTQSKREIEIIVSVFNGNVVLPTTKNQLDKFINGFNLWASKGKIRLEPVVTKNNFILPSLNNSWLAGFTDGQGCFTCSICDKGFNINFNIVEKGEINLIILQQLCLLFKAGKVSKHSVNNVYEYWINGIKNCSNVFSYFDKYKLLTKKSLSYILWKEIQEDLKNKDHFYKLKRLEVLEKATMINKSNII